MKLLLIVHFKVCKGNFFVVILNSFGKVLSNINSGCLGFKNIQKRTIDALYSILNFVFEFTLRIQGISFIILRLEGIKYYYLNKIYNFFIKKLRKHRIYLLGFKVINSIPHNGCTNK